jgi:hypothetical protein
MSEMFKNGESMQDWEHGEFAVTSTADAISTLASNASSIDGNCSILRKRARREDKESRIEGSKRGLSPTAGKLQILRWMHHVIPDADLTGRIVSAV